MKKHQQCPETELIVQFGTILVAANHGQPAMPLAANVNANALAYAKHLAYINAHAMAQDLENPAINGHLQNHANGYHHHAGRKKK